LREREREKERKNKEGLINSKFKMMSLGEEKEGQAKEGSRSKTHKIFGNVLFLKLMWST
jgi:hypothetical protein